MNEIHCCVPEAAEPRLCGPGDRRAFAARPIREGEVILRNLPTALALLDEYRSDRCSYCLSSSRQRQQQTDISKNATSNPTLLRCSRCHETKYCSHFCQERDFPFHKIECREATILFGSSNTCATETTTTPFDNNNEARLLVRNFLARNQNSNKCHEMSAQDVVPPITCCGNDHFQSLAKLEKTAFIASDSEQADRAAKAIWNQRKALQKNTVGSSKSSIPSQLSELRSQMEQDLRRFRVNNFGVTDPMVRVCASGVYPLGALLNHSCAPNCILRYSFEQGQQRPPVMEIVAARDIGIGEELTHSYVELVCPTSSRRAKLKALYGFDCDCPRCCPVKTDRFLFHLPESYMAMKSSELIQWILRHYNPFVVQSKISLIGFDQEKILRPLSDCRAKKATQELLDIARVSLLNGSVQDELEALQQAVKVLEEAAKSEEPSPLYALYSPELYSARGDRLGSLIVAGDTEQAISECEHIVAFLCLALNHLGSHAMLGLQLFTLGDLYEAGGYEAKAKVVFRWAYKILQVSHGTKCEITRLLVEKVG